MAEADFERYFRAQQVAPQWLSVLRALGGELAQQATPEDLRALMKGVGRRLANSSGEEFASANTLSSLQAALNAFWLAQQWGWVELVERDGIIDITHHAAPLAEAFGEEALGWSCGVLEGFYEALFHALGAGGRLAAHAVDSRAHGLVLRFCFGA